MGAFHSLTENSGFKFRAFHVTNGTDFLVGWTNLSQAITFQVSRKLNTNSKTRENIKMADSVRLLLELFNDSEVEYDEEEELIFSA